PLIRALLFINATAPPAISPLSLHDALPIFDDGAAVAAHDITVQATQSIDRWDRSASADGGFFGGGSSPKQGDFHAKREINYDGEDRKSTRLNSSHVAISYAVFCLKKKKKKT